MIDTTDTFVIDVGQTEPSLTFPVTSNGESVDLAQAAITDAAFTMQKDDDATIGFTRRAATILDWGAPDGDPALLEYQWASTDTLVAGRYRGWFTLISGDILQDLPSFEFEVRDPAYRPAAYCSVSDVKARAGRIGRAWTGQSDVSETIIGRFCEDVAAQIDARLSAHGITVPVDKTTVAGRALAALNADGALLLALPAQFQGESDETSRVLAETRKRYDAAMKSIADGSAGIIAILGTGSSVLASSLSVDEPSYGWGWPWAPGSWSETDWDPGLRPNIRRGQRF